MTVHDRSWRGWSGRSTSRRRRPLVVARYALSGIFASRAFTALYVVAALPTVVALAYVYVVHNAALLARFGLPPDALLGSVAPMFPVLFSWQATLGFFVAVAVGPGLIAPDLSHGGLSLYLARPLGRPGYVLGKFLVLAFLLLPVTVLGGLVVVLLQASLADGWLADNLNIAGAFLLGHGAWIVVVGLLALAISAWVRWKMAARAVLLGVFFVLGGMGEVINLILRTHWGDLLNLGQMLTVVSARLLATPEAKVSAVPVAAAWAALGGAVAVSLLVLDRKLRAHEVVR